MPRIQQRVVGTSLYMYKTSAAAQDGVARGGSGVLIGQPSDRVPDLVHLYAVTNAHVVERGGIVARASRHDGTARIFDRPRNEWELHPEDDDVAVCWLETVPAYEDHPIQSVPREWLATYADFGSVAWRKEWPWSTGPVVAGEDTFSVGRFVGYDGKERNQPLVRFGNLSSPEPVPVYQHERQPPRHQDSLLVEARSLTGASGTPVFAYRGNQYFNGGVPPVEEGILLGVGWGHVRHPNEEDEDVPGEGPDAPSIAGYNSGIMAVVPAWKLTELLDHPKVAAVRRRHEDNEPN